MSRPRPRNWRIHPLSGDEIKEPDEWDLSSPEGVLDYIWFHPKSDPESNTGKRVDSLRRMVAFGESPTPMNWEITFQYLARTDLLKNNPRWRELRDFFYGKNGVCRSD